MYSFRLWLCMYKLRSGMSDVGTLVELLLGCKNQISVSNGTDLCSKLLPCVGFMCWLWWSCSYLTVYCTISLVSVVPC
jgi:hypothetical protein